MSIVVLADVRIPDEFIQADMSGALSRENDRSSVPAGFMSINVVRDITLRYWQIGVIPMLASEWDQIEAVYEVSDAGAFGVLLRDPKDSNVSQARGKLQGYMLGVEAGLTGFGNGGPRYGLRKVYAAGSQVRSRPITRPASGAILYRGGTPVTIGVGAGNAAISAGPAYVTFVADASRAVNSVTVGATTQVVLASAIPGLVVGGRLWLDTLSGANAALLNDQSHQITNISSATYTLATNTAGKTITAGSGQARKYPQPDEALAWAGAYDVPVHFRDDDISWQTVAAQDGDGEILVVGSGIYLDEVREA